MSRIILPDVVVGHDFTAAAQHWSELLHRYVVGVFAILFLVVSASGIQVVSTYMSSHIALPTFSNGSHVPAPPLRGPNMLVPSPQLETTLQKIKTQPLNLIIDGKTVPVSPETIEGWLKIVTDHRTQVAYLHVDNAAVGPSLEELVKVHTKAPVNQVSVTHEDGASVVISSGQDGTGISDMAAINRQISQGLLGAKGLQIDVPLKPVPFQTVNATSIDKLLEVNVVTKQMWAYDKGVLTRSFPISAGAPATPTPVGQFKIYQKLPVQDMRGFNADGTRYFQPHVRWVNYFLTGGYAVHGNYWRSQSWFGAINSSHGCVSLPDEQAKWVYDWAPIGTTVITHR